MADDVIVLEPGDERAQKIAKAMASPTAGDILQAMKDGPKTSTDLADQLHLPMSTVKYHIGNLLEAGVLEVSETRYSVKGREVKVYTLKDQLLIVAPRNTSIRSLLLKYASIFSVFLLATLVVVAMTPIISQAPPSGPDGSLPGMNISQVTSPGETTSAPVTGAHDATQGIAGTGKEMGETTGGSSGNGGKVLPLTPGPTVSAPFKQEGTGGTLTIPETATGTPAIATIPVTTGAEVPQKATPAPSGFVTREHPPVSIPSSFSPALIFFAGGMVLLVVVIGYDIFSRPRKR
jgi:DNA-binding transcriptional ArsR family regulator